MIKHPITPIHRYFYSPTIWHTITPILRYSITPILISALATLAQTGTVLDKNTDDPIKNAIVRLKSTGDLALTDEDGTFDLGGAPVKYGVLNRPALPAVIIRNNGLQFTVTGNNTSVRIEMFKSNGMKIAEIANETFTEGTHTLKLPHTAANLTIVSATIGNARTTFRLIAPSDSRSFALSPSHPIAQSRHRAFATSTKDTLIISRYGYTSTAHELSSDNTIRLEISENTPPPGMMRLESASFVMGANLPDKFEQNEIPPHAVTLSSYFIDTTEVTQADYALLMGVEPWLEYEPPNISFKYPGKGNYLPVWYLYWGDAALYCNARSKRDGLDTVYTYSAVNGTFGSGCELEDVEINYEKKGYRLPTEAEWEYAARAGSHEDYYWGNGEDAAEYACFSDTGPRPVASLLPNDFGLYDMTGNVFEFVNDLFSFYSDEPVTDPIGPEEGDYRLIKGGSWDADLRSIGRIPVRLPVNVGVKRLAQGIRVVLPDR